MKIHLPTIIISIGKIVLGEKEEEKEGGVLIITIDLFRHRLHQDELDQKVFPKVTLVKVIIAVVHH